MTAALAQENDGWRCKYVQIIHPVASSCHGREKQGQVDVHVGVVATFQLTQSHRTIIVRLISTAQTGYFYTTQRVRQGPKLSAVKYDPKGALLVYFDFFWNNFHCHLSEAAGLIRWEQENEKIDSPLQKNVFIIGKSSWMYSRYELMMD